MKIKYENNDNYLLVAVKGRLDTFTVEELEKNYLENIYQAGKPVIVDCSGLEYISSAGLRLILTMAKKLRQSKFCLYGAVGLVAEVIFMAGFSNIIPIYSSREDAITYISL